MKKVTALLSMMVLLLLAACGGNQGASGSSDSNGDEKVIEVWHIETGEREKLFQEVAEAV